MLKLKRPTRKWLWNGIPTRILTTEMKPWKNFEKYLKLIKTSLIHKNAKFMTHMDSKVQKQLHSAILKLATLKICSQDFSRIINLTMIPSSAVSLVTSSQMEERGEDCSVLLVLVKVCLIMRTFSLEEVASKVDLLAALAATEVDSVELLNLWVRQPNQCMNKLI